MEATVSQESIRCQTEGCDEPQTWERGLNTGWCRYHLVPLPSRADPAPHAKVIYDTGEHNADIAHFRAKLIQQGKHKDQSIAVLTTTRGHIPVHVVVAWRAMRSLISQPWSWQFTIAGSTADGYNKLVLDALKDTITWKYFLFLEDDVIVPPDVIQRLVNGMEQGWDAVGALCWNRIEGEKAVPIIMGDPKDESTGFLPQPPIEHGLQPCRATHLGCTLVKADIFRDKRFPIPWFWEGVKPGTDAIIGFTPDVVFFEQAGKLGYKVAVDVDLHVGHFDRETGRTF